MKFNVFYIILFVLCTSCTVYEPIQLQVLKPANVQVDPNISRLVLVNHSNYVKPGDELLKDSIRTAEFFSGLGGILINSPRYEVVQSPIYYKLKEYSDRFQKLDWKEVESICRDSFADAALVLENYQVTYTDPLRLTFSPNYGLYAKMVVENVSLWRFYYPKEQKISEEFLHRDTLIWDATGYSEEDVVAQLPDIEEAILQSCWYAGQRFGQYISPYWIPRKRYIINCEKTDFQRAVSYAQNNYWEKAIEIWKKYVYSKKKRLAAFATYNLAVASETLDHIDIALEWAAKSYFLQKNDYVSKYIELLEKRKKEKEDYLKFLENK